MKRKNKILIPVLFASLAVSMFGCKPAASAASEASAAPETSASAANSVEAIKKAGVLKLATGNYKPFEFRDSKTNELVGYDIDVAKRVADKLGVKLKAVDMDFPAIIPSVQKGDYDLAIAAMYDTEERRKAVDMTDSYMNTGMVLVTLANNSTFHTLADLNGKRVGVKASATSEKVANDAKTKNGYTYEVVSYKDTTGCIADLEAGRVDAVVNDQLNQLEINKTDPKIKIVGKPFTTSKLAGAVKKGNESLLKVVNETIQEMEKDGSAQKLYDKWITGKE
ncbi:MAG: ABC transporter substrate-binding protein [Oscillospiraceae bacterium]|jgi:ABC-type amino acid transport substrate-binding protein|nr:ABC transporter substrate-binding protein [Oscillospiraceae bacterium]MCI1990492.1 ABC transporter substrate-binding protein [Oscillospiraceae bacterium]MCI2034652.1 ABC transporter substrate-binding protein [Oscillospiraceae bacterium]